MRHADRVQGLFWNAPRWVLCVLYGVAYAVLMTVVSYTARGHLLSAAIVSVVAGAVYGVGAGFVVGGQQRRMRAAVGPLPPGSERAVSRAAARGQVPVDAAVRGAAGRLAAYRLSRYQQRRTITPVAFAVLIGLSLLGATTSPWGWAAAGVFAALLVAWLLSGRHLRHRVALLTPQP